MADIPLPPPQVPLTRNDSAGKPTQQGYEFWDALRRGIKALAAVTNIFNNLNATASTALLNVFTSALKGLVPASGGGTANFLRADGTFAVPPGTAAGGATLITSASFPAATTWNFTNLGGYKYLLVCLRGVSQSSGSSQVLQCAVSGNNGSSYGSVKQTAGAVSFVSGGLVVGTFVITRCDQTNNQYVGPQQMTTVTLSNHIDSSSRGPIDAFQLNWSGGASFSAGDIEVYGLK